MSLAEADADIHQSRNHNDRARTREGVKALEREVMELRRANEKLKLASAFFTRGCPELCVNGG